MGNESELHASIFGDHHFAGIWQETGIPSQGAALNNTLARGLKYNVLARLAASVGLETKALGRLLGISRSTLLRRERAGRFNEAESDRLYRMAKVYQASLDLFEGDKEATHHWLKKSIKGLGNARPIDMLRTMAGTETVLNLIGRLEYGIPA